MKLLGQFTEKIGNRYMDLLEQNKIEVEARDIPTVGYATKSQIISYMRVELYVPEHQYAMAIQILKDSEKKAQEEFKHADGTMLKIAVGFVCLIGAVLYLGHCKGWW